MYRQSGYIFVRKKKDPKVKKMFLGRYSKSFLRGISFFLLNAVIFFCFSSPGNTFAQDEYFKKDGWNIPGYDPDREWEKENWGTEKIQVFSSRPPYSIIFYENINGQERPIFLFTVFKFVSKEKIYCIYLSCCECGIVNKNKSHRELKYPEDVQCGTLTGFLFFDSEGDGIFEKKIPSGVILGAPDPPAYLRD